MKTLTLASCLALIFPAVGLADGYPAVPLYTGNQTVIGEEISYPSAGPAAVTAAIVTLAPGEKTIVHKHGVPLFIYILEGEVTVTYTGHGKRTYHAGDSFLEAMDAEHVGHNTGDTPVRILAVYMGAEGSRDVIPKE